MSKERDREAELYAQGCVEAYGNSKSPVEDARILCSAGRYPRAYALGVLSAEEFAKSFVYKGFSEGWIKPEQVALFRNALVGRGAHKAKVGLFKTLAVLTYSLFSDPKNWPVIESGRLPDSKNRDVVKAEKIWKIFERAEDLKLDPIYADIKEDEVKTPQIKITWQMAKEILEFMTEITIQYDVPNQEFRTVTFTQGESKK